METTKDTKTSKLRVNSDIVYYTIIDAIKSNKTPYGLLDISKQNLNKTYISKLKKLKIIEKKSRFDWHIHQDYENLTTDELLHQVNQRVNQSSLGSRVEKPTTNLHALQLNFPITEGKIYDKDWQIKEKLNNWLPKYTTLNLLGGLTIKNNNNKSISVYAHARDLKSMDLGEIDSLAFKIRLFVINYFKKEGVNFDWDRISVKNLNLATQDKESESMIRKGEKFELDLKKPSEKIFEADNNKAKAWIDGSPYKFTAETNDKEWKRWYLAMPFAIKDIYSLSNEHTTKMREIELYAQEIKAHREAIKQITEVMKDIQDFLKGKDRP